MAATFKNAHDGKRCVACEVSKPRVAGGAIRQTSKPKCDFQFCRETWAFASSPTSSSSSIRNTTTTTATTTTTTTTTLDSTALRKVPSVYQTNFG
ncbi:hypothetical protein LSH36_748g00005 [Paralvinella palmiformis]|uniref:Uncharacterized protein n=1 Tax=Paralvinella palmiformis TaxID=53620 RepID=A0AAD9MUQ2_9ANNE|nr:hypothetical protein LSH36_748g00005 [Paralvinella palmiformis]